MLREEMFRALETVDKNDRLPTWVISYNRFDAPTLTRIAEWERLDDVHVVTKGGRNPSYREEDGQRVMKQSEITIRVNLSRGKASATVWTCDLSHDYVTINADYRS